MDASGPVHVVIKLEHTAETIRGQIAVEGAPAADFFGWLELIDRLERAASAAHRRTAIRALTQ